MNKSLSEVSAQTAMIPPTCTSQLMQNYRLAAPIFAGTQIAAAPNRSNGQSEVYSIGTDGHVYRISMDSGSDTGWNVSDRKFPGKATHLAVAGNLNGSVDIYASDEQNRNSQIYIESSYLSLASGIGNNALQVFGIQKDGFAYVVTYQDAQGNWHNAQDDHWDLGGKLPGPTA
ncbi:hypothetical protein [Candidatus Nitrosacidococcus tergens]|uniref:Fucose-specific lectin n=1 Tax=Candidatus Nitrosacidococcus tergens TaxID=553981 RepID=A0A7G1Q9P8_9GAMM|nr:hypothetical protein [Candidatus Nitrosacidococcus tergens]CAB1276138.1 protein of unknown function [Candidatus Nitrosacidococcus tergens]